MTIWIVSAGHIGSSPRLFRSFSSKIEAAQFAKQQQETSRWNWVDFMSHKVETDRFNFHSPDLIILEHKQNNKIEHEKL